jgi:hypothetical protein
MVLYFWTPRQDRGRDSSEKYYHGLIAAQKDKHILGSASTVGFFLQPN